ncbi:MAG: glycosyltransferase family 2 protein [Anaerolineae bacterium]
MDLSIVIVNWNTRDLLAQCLASVYAHPPDCVFDVWVVDNASTDGSAAMVRERFPQVHLIENRENVGFARANNQAIRASTGRYVLLLNSDAWVRPMALHRMVEFMDAYPIAGAAGPRLLNPDGTLQPSAHPMSTLWREGWHLFHLDALRRLSTYEMHRWSVDQPRPVEVASGACLCLRRAALDQIGLLNERYFMYAEEVDICYRLAQLRWQVWWVPQAEVVHLGGGSTTMVSDEMLVELYRSKHRFICEAQGWMAGEAFRAILLVASLARVMVGVVVEMVPGVDHEHVRIKMRQYRRLLRQLASFRV